MALTADIFELLKDGNIISGNSKNEFTRRIVDYLSNEKSFKDNQEIFNTLGYILIREYNCFYLTKKKELNEKELDKFIQRYKDVFLALSILKSYLPAISSGSELNKSDLIASANKNSETKVKEILEYLTKKEDNLSGSIEIVLKKLRESGIIEQLDKSNEERYFILDSLDYFNGILKQLEMSNA